jgi:inosine-uridine nucleoside N-ribohydrolase
MLRSPWFWIVVGLIAIGVATSAALGVLYWLLGALAAGLAALAITYLAAAYAVGHAHAPPISPLQGLSASERIPVVFDCDITTGHLFREVDDGLVLLYLLGEPRLELLSVTCTYGNGPVEMTTRTTRRLLDKVGYGNIDVWPGASGPGKDPQANKAAQHLVDTVRGRRGEIVLIATGSMTNLKHAATLDPSFFGNLRGLYLMGGVTAPLVWNGRRLAEINFALDPEAAYQAVRADCPVTLAPGGSGLTAVFRGPQYAALQALGDPVSRLIARRIRSWFALMRLYFRDGGFAMWDSVAALMLTKPGLFDYERGRIMSTQDNLHTGQLVIEPDAHGTVRIVRAVLDFQGFMNAHFTAWHHLSQHAKTRRSK